MTTTRVAIVTGTSTGIGLSTAIHLAKGGFRVVATMRNPSKADALQSRASQEGVAIDVARLDVEDDASIDTCVDDVIAKYGRIDVLVNNAGAGRLGSVEQVSLDELRRTFEVNFFGVWKCTQAVLPVMREAQAGRIISVTSLGGLFGQPFNDAYCAAKFAVEGMMESLAAVAKRLGIDVCLVEPGPVHTEFVETVTKLSASSAATPIEDYAPLFDAYMGNIRGSFASAGQTPEDIAKVIVEAATSDAPHFRYVTSDAMSGIVKHKYVDPTGNSIVAMGGARLKAP